MIKTPLKTIRDKCKDCCGYEYSRITNCEMSNCPLYQLRFGRKPKGLTYVKSLQDKDKGQLTPVKSMRAYCLECCLGSSKEVELCPAEKCPLHPYRFGKRPKGVEEDVEEEE